MTRFIQFAVFFVFSSLIVGGLHYYVWMRLVRDPVLPAPWRQVATWALVVLGVSIPAAMFIGRVLPFQMTRGVTFVPFIWLGTWFIIVSALAGIDLVKLILFLINKVGGSGPLVPDPSRRLALARIAAGTVGLAAGVLTSFGIAQAIGLPVVRRVEVPLTRLPAALHGLKIVQITDLHIGLTLGRDWLVRVVEQVRQLNPDLIAITGDLVDGKPDGLHRHVQPLSRLTAPLGVFFVTGNHEYYSGASDWIPVLEDLGLRVLRNERVEVSRNGAAFDLAGIDDYDGARMERDHGPDLERALAERDPTRELVLLSHQPRVADEAANKGVGLVLSGHTHGGQIWPMTHLARLQQPYISGLHHHLGQTWVYVSEGTGFWGPPIRIGTRSEISEIVLLNKDKKTT